MRDLGWGGSAPCACMGAGASGLGWGGALRPRGGRGVWLRLPWKRLLRMMNQPLPPSLLKVNPLTRHCCGPLPPGLESTCSQRFPSRLGNSQFSQYDSPPA